MNTLKTDINGGFPFRLDDLRFLDAAQREAFVGVIKALIGDLPYAVLNGCQYTINPDGTWHINEGYVYFNAEIFFAPAQDLAALTTGGYFWEENVTYDHSGDKAFEVDGVVHSTYEVRRAHLVEKDPGTEGTMPPMLADNIVTILKNRLGIDTSPQWTELTLDSTLVSIETTGSLSSINGALRYKNIGKTFFANLSLDITVSSSDSNTQTIKIMLPGAMKPISGIIYSIIGDNDPSISAAIRMYFLKAYSDNNYLTITTIYPGDAFIDRSYKFSGGIFYEIA
jgi:hypothetical protein